MAKLRNILAAGAGFSTFFAPVTRQNRSFAALCCFRSCAGEVSAEQPMPMQISIKRSEGNANMSNR